ncbi:ATP-dependent protease LonB [Carboxydothermus hydrogenoformans]|uniref:endopeptidase La n=1 Tax=Carboxydothermus hydrogenoformans (strain ATCC BAA-161 / DSM 6008 / Z-2901) TaxID=246194 RepID=Q3AF92_CARHZ|nr:ATP-dependent protease LonB [Carboxydothermus hydrogenoformans]ABB15957.1 putative ATP-dependent protease La [Carboxydothermus hydrogenoformans Z-2901]
MDGFSGILAVGQIILLAAILALLFSQGKAQQVNKSYLERESEKELAKLNHLRRISLTEPLAEKTRPENFSEIIGQEEGIEALKAALCGPNPQHVILYGPPGVGKTAAARLVLKEAIKSPASPFKEGAAFVEVDATCTRFDERGIADPLLGSVHDPIYQGAGPLGIAGIPQPKPGAVTKAHGGILFIDEIGELHPVQMNKLLKVLEDRKVFLESAYYFSENPEIPQHIHEIFQKGLPADFRLIGATTRKPEELPPALRSRCVEIFFKPLGDEEIREIAQNAAKKIGISLGKHALQTIVKYANSGREAVNIVQLAAGLALGEGRKRILARDVLFVARAGNYHPKPQIVLSDEPAIGRALGLAVTGPKSGAVLAVEALAEPAENLPGSINVSGIIEEEKFSQSHTELIARSKIRGALDNVFAVFRSQTGINPQKYDIYFNFPAPWPVDGPSAGLALLVALYSAVFRCLIPAKTAFTGEISLLGEICPVGGIPDKIEAAVRAGVKTVFLPWGNYPEVEGNKKINLVPVKSVDEALNYLFAGKDQSLPSSLA